MVKKTHQIHFRAWPENSAWLKKIANSDNGAVSRYMNMLIMKDQENRKKPVSARSRL